MHVHLVVSRSMAVLSLTLCMLHPFGVQAQSGAQATWVISSLHPDPTPALGAPDAEFIALHAGSADPSTLDTLSTDGLVLSWNGHERTLPPGSWPAGSTVVVHRASDSVEFSGWAADRIGLSSWPALVNGGARVALFDSAGVLLDAVLYDEAALSGGGRPLLRKDPSACGAMVNFQPWSAPADPFEPLNEPLETGHVALTSDALKTEAERVERLIIRGPGRLEWRLPGPVDPRSMLEAEWRIGGGARAGSGVAFGFRGVGHVDRTGGIGSGRPVRAGHAGSAGSLEGLRFGQPTLPLDGPLDRAAVLGGCSGGGPVGRPVARRPLPAH